MKVVSFESLFKSNKTWLSQIEWSCLSPIWIGFMSFLFYFVMNNNNNNNKNNNYKSIYKSPFEMDFSNLNGKFITTTETIIIIRRRTIIIIMITIMILIIITIIRTIITIIIIAIIKMTIIIKAFIKVRELFHFNWTFLRTSCFRSSHIRSMYR